MLLTDLNVTDDRPGAAHPYQIIAAIAHAPEFRGLLEVLDRERTRRPDYKYAAIVAIASVDPHLASDLERTERIAAGQAPEKERLRALLGSLPVLLREEQIQHGCCDLGHK